MKDTGLNGYVYDFSVDYDANSVDDIKDIINIGWRKIKLHKMFLTELTVLSSLTNAAD